MVHYAPSQHTVGLDTVSFTYNAFFDGGTQPLSAASPPFVFRFNIIPVNHVPVILPQTVTGTGAPQMLVRLQYYDVEQPHSTLLVTLDPLLGFFDPLSTLPHNVSTAGGVVTLLPASALNATDPGTREALVFRYEPNGGSYQVRCADVCPMTLNWF